MVSALASPEFNPYDEFKTSSIGTSYHAATSEGSGAYTFTLASSSTGAPLPTPAALPNPDNGKGEKVAQSTMIRLRKLNNSLNCYNESHISEQMVEELLAPRGGLSESERQYMTSSLRQFCSFLTLLGIDAAIVPPKYMRAARSEFRPYIFSDNELHRLASAADALSPARRSSVHQQVYPVLVRLLIGTGMRIGEVLALTRADVDPSNGVINVINGKNGVSRYIPVAYSLKKILHDYADTIDMAEGNKPSEKRQTSTPSGTHSAPGAWKKCWKVEWMSTQPFRYLLRMSAM